MAPRSGTATQTARRAGTRRRWSGLPWALLAVITVVVAGGLVALDRVYVRREQTPSGDPASRAAGAVRSISGADNVRNATYDAATKAAQVDAVSRYYDAKKTLKENREYLATEGRLGAQLALFGNTEVQAITIRLYTGASLLATVTARQGQKFEEMTTAYSGPLAQR